MEFLATLTRRKPIESKSATKLKRCLTTIDITALGIGSTLGLGIYVLAGQVASLKAGPSVVLSFFIAAVASIFAGLCYAEFGARVPKAGSAYVYSYVTVGEFMAYVIGWNLTLEYVIGTASVARGYSGYLDSLIGDSIQTHLREWMPINVSWLSSYPDFFALGITLLLAAMLALGVKESSAFNNTFTLVNLIVVLYAIIVGSFKADLNNWSLSKEEVNRDGRDGGNGGFFPFGLSGMMAGAATCFYGFVGFDAIATTGEEVINPQKSIPISIVLSLLFVSLAYSGVSAIQTLIWPYYDQNQEAPLPYVFDKVGYPVAKWVISVGALAGLSTSLLGAMFPMPRVLYAMASDRLLFKFLANVNERFKTPVNATLISGCFAGIMAALFDVSELADMMSIDTLVAYSLVAVSVLILRYREDEPYISTPNTTDNVSVDEDCDNGSVTSNSFNRQHVINISSSVWKQIFNSNLSVHPNSISSRISTRLIVAVCFLVITLNIILVIFEEQLYSLSLPIAVIIPLLMITALIIIGLIAIARQPTSKKEISFKVPGVPVIPILSLFANTNLMLHLSAMTWYRFAIWMTIGVSIYFFYGRFNSIGYLTESEKRLESSSFSSITSETSESPASTTLDISKRKEYNTKF